MACMPDAQVNQVLDFVEFLTHQSHSFSEKSDREQECPSDFWALHRSCTNTPIEVNEEGILESFSISDILNG